MTTRRVTLAAALIGLASPAHLLAQGTPEGPLRIGGTGLALAAMRELAGRFSATLPAASRLVVLPSLGTGGGLAAMSAGAITFALAARPINGAEQASGVKATCYAQTPLVFVTQIATAANDVTRDEVASIYAGRITRWPDGSPLRLVRREPSDAAWTLLRSLSPSVAEAVEEVQRRPGLLTAGNDQANGDALERLRGSFGAMTLGQLKSEGRLLKALLLDGAAPETEGQMPRRYPMWHELHIAWKGDLPPLAAAFLDFVLRPEGQAVLAGLGHTAPGAGA